MGKAHVLTVRLSWSESLVESEAVAGALKPMQRLFDAPADRAHVVVAITKNVVAGRETVHGAFDLHLVELPHVELVIADSSPVMRWRSASGNTAQANRRCG